MTYYEKLMARMDKAMDRHPRSTVVMTADTFKVLAAGSNARKVANTMRKKLKPHQVPVIFRRPMPNETWIL